MSGVKAACCYVPDGTNKFVVDFGTEGVTAVFHKPDTVLVAKFDSKSAISASSYDMQDVDCDLVMVLQYVHAHVME